MRLVSGPKKRFTSISVSRFGFLFGATMMLLALVTIFIIRSGHKGYKSGQIWNYIEDVPSNIDAILILGGGVPSALDEPPVYVQQRCDDAAAVIAKIGPTPILCLSAGTAHLPQLMSADGRPIWEATSSAAYLAKAHGIKDQVYVETTSFDTIGNAYFARTSHTDIVGWRRLLIVTNHFHMDRSKAIFDWIFGIGGRYELFYFASKDVGLSGEALEARRVHETKSAITVRDKLAPQFSTLPEVWGFLMEKHDLYSAGKLIDGTTNAHGRDDALKASYGAPIKMT